MQAEERRAEKLHITSECSANALAYCGTHANSHFMRIDGTRDCCFRDHQISHSMFLAESRDPTSVDEWNGRHFVCTLHPPPLPHPTTDALIVLFRTGFEGVPDKLDFHSLAKRFERPGVNGFENWTLEVPFSVCV